jgi:hypothetical protein
MQLVITISRVPNTFLWFVFPHHVNKGETTQTRVYIILINYCLSTVYLIFSFSTYLCNIAANKHNIFCYFCCLLLIYYRFVKLFLYMLALYVNPPSCLCRSKFLLVWPRMSIREKFNNKNSKYFSFYSVYNLNVSYVTFAFSQE